MAGVLEFALGLESSNFLREIGASSRAVLSFATVAEGVHFSIEKMADAMERGAHLNDLSARTGETVGNLYQLEEAFKRVGLSAENVDPVIQRVRKALSGVNEMGGKTDSIFTALGLDRNQLAQQSPIEAIKQITGALHKLSPNDMAGAASGLFGRGAAADMIQIANSAEDMAESLKHSAGDAAVFAKNAKDFDGVGDVIVEIKSHVQGMWAGLASGLMPELKMALDKVESFSRKLGPALAQGVRDGELKELIGLGIMAGVEKGTPYFVAFANAFTITLAEAIAEGFMIGTKTAGANFINNLMTAAKAGKNADDQEIVQGDLARDSQQIKRFSQAGDKNKVEFWRGKLNEDTAKSNELFDQQAAIEAQFKGTKAAIVAAAIKGMMGGNLYQTFTDNFKPDTSGGTPTYDAFVKKLDEKYAKFMAINPAAVSGSGGSIQPPNAGYQPQVTDLEKIGFIFGNGMGGNDLSARTATATEKTADLVAACSTHLATIAGWDWKGGSLVNE